MWRDVSGNRSYFLCTSLEWGTDGESCRLIRTFTALPRILNQACGHQFVLRRGCRWRMGGCRPAGFSGSGQPEVTARLPAVDCISASQFLVVNMRRTTYMWLYVFIPLLCTYVCMCILAHVWSFCAVSVFLFVSLKAYLCLCLFVFVFVLYVYTILLLYACVCVSVCACCLSLSLPYGSPDSLVVMADDVMAWITNSDTCSGIITRPLPKHTQKQHYLQPEPEMQPGE